MTMATIRPTSNDTSSITSPSNSQATVNPKSSLSDIHSGKNTAKTVRPQDGAVGEVDVQNVTIRPRVVSNPDTLSTINPNGLQEKCIMSQQDNENPVSTMRPNADINADFIQHNPTTLPNSSKNYSGPPRSIYNIEGTLFTVIKPLSLTSGEAQVYLVENSVGKKYVLKLYYKGISPNLEILKKVKAANHANILFKEISYGVYEDGYYELMKYYEGSSLDHVDVRKRESVIISLIKKMAIAIDFCHQLGIIHRDIKPSNFVFEDETQVHLLLGDFGIAVTCNKDGECVSDMARTKIYAAPEVYLNIGDGKAMFSTKSDFYSLGISIIYLWMGQEQFIHFEKENELQLATMKAYGTLPIPGDMPLRLISLVKALIEPNPKRRAGFKEVEAWIKGNDPFGDNTKTAPLNQKKKTFHVVFDGEKGLVASSPQELANLMLANQRLGTTYLYKGKLTQWLEENGRPEQSIEMERIKEDLYPANTTAGLEAACYVLDPSLPYIDPKNNTCRTSSEISASILSDFNTYIFILSRCIDSRLIVFLHTHGLVSVVSDFKKEFSLDKRRGLLYLAYRLDSKAPWLMTDKRGHEFRFNASDEILNWVSLGNTSDQALSDIVSKAFLLWIASRNKTVAAIIEPLIQNEGDIEYSEGVLYRLNPQAGLYYIIDTSSPHYCQTIKQIGQLLNNCMMDKINDTSETKWGSNLLSDVLKIQQGKKSSLYHYLESKGPAYAKWLDWIKFCLDINSKDNQLKAGPYNTVIGLFKIVKGMSGEALFRFKSGKVISNPSELSKVAKDDIIHATHNSMHPLEAWIAVFYQEDPKLDLSPKFTYEKRTAEYINFLHSIPMDLPEVKRYIDSKFSVEMRAVELKDTLEYIKRKRNIVILLTVLPLCVAAILLFFFWRPDFGVLEFETIFGPLAVIMTICLCFADKFVGKLIGEIICGCIIAAILAAIIQWLYRSASSVAPYVASASLLWIGWYFYKTCIKTNLKEYENENLLNPDFEHLELEPLYEAFHPNSKTFDSSIKDESVAYQTYLSQVKKKIGKRAVPIGVITIISIAYFLFVSLVNSSSYDVNVPSNTTVETLSVDKTEYGDASQEMNNSTSALLGNWVGEINGEQYRCHFEMVIDSDEFQMVCSNLANANTLTFTGYYNAGESQLMVQECKTDYNSGEATTVSSSGTLILREEKIIGTIDFQASPFETISIDLQHVPE